MRKMLYCSGKHISSGEPLVYWGGFEKSRLKKRFRSCCSLCGDSLAPILGVVFGVGPLLSPAGSVQLLESFLSSENFSTGIMAVARIKVVFSIVVFFSTPSIAKVFYSLVVMWHYVCNTYPVQRTSSSLVA